MRSSLPSLRSVSILLFALFVFALLLVNADFAMDGVRQGLSLCTETLFPSLFPFLVLSELLIASGAGEALGRLFSRPVAALFGLSESGAASLILGFFCGFPVGTTSAMAFYRKEELSREELQRLVLFANNPSSGFLIGAVGEALFGSKTVGIALFCITLLSASTLGLFLHIFFGKVNQKYKTAGNGIRKSFSAADFTAGVKRAFSSLLQVCAFVLFFSCISKCLAPLILELNLPQSAGVLLSGILEMTSGISGAITLLSPSLAFLFIAFFASFAGLSVALQIFSVAEEAHLPLWPYLAARLVQGALALLYASLFLWLFKPDFIIARSVAVMTPALQAASSPALLLAVLLPLLLLFLPAKKKGLRRRKPERKEKI